MSSPPYILEVNNIKMVLETYLNGKKHTTMWKGSRSETQMAVSLTKQEIWLNEQTELLLQNTCTIFTWMQDNSKPRPPQKSMSAKRQCIYPNLWWSSKNKSAKRIFYYYFHTLNTENMSYSMYIYQSASLSWPSHTSVRTRARTHTHTHTPLTFPSSSLPFHNMSSLVSFTILDLQHFLKPFKVTPGETHCHAIMIHTD